MAKDASVMLRIPQRLVFVAACGPATYFSLYPVVAKEYAKTLSEQTNEQFYSYLRGHRRGPERSFRGIVDAAQRPHCRHHRGVRGPDRSAFIRSRLAGNLCGRSDRG